MRYWSLTVVFLVVGCNADRLAKLEAQNEELKAQLKQQQTAANLDLQGKCAKQAGEAFKVQGYEKEQYANYTNHYNAKLNKCFIKIESMDTKTAKGTFFTNKVVMDAFEGKGYAEYMWMSDKVKKYWDVPPKLCKVTVPSGEEKVCKSSEEFDELLKPYMEQ